MHRAILSMFRRPEPIVPAEDPNAPVKLPSSCLDAIDAAIFSVRPGRGDDDPRVMVTFPHHTPFLIADDGGAGFLGGVFNELSERQLSKAVQRVRFRVAAALSGASPDPRGKWTRSTKVGGGLVRDPWDPPRGEW